MADRLTYKSQSGNRWELEILPQYKNTEVKVTCAHKTCHQPPYQITLFNAQKSR